MDVNSENESVKAGEAPVETIKQEEVSKTDEIPEGVAEFFKASKLPKYLRPKEGKKEPVKDDKPDISPLEIRRGFKKPSEEDCYRLRWWVKDFQANLRMPGDFVWDLEVHFMRWAYGKGVSATSLAALMTLTLSQCNDILRGKSRGDVGPGFPITVPERAAGFRGGNPGPVELYKEWNMSPEYVEAFKKAREDSRLALQQWKIENNIFDT